MLIITIFRHLITLKFIKSGFSKGTISRGRISGIASNLMVVRHLKYCGAKNLFFPFGSKIALEIPLLYM